MAKRLGAETLVVADDVAGLRRSLAAGEVDAILVPAGLVGADVPAAVPKRRDARDAVIGAKLGTLPAGAKVAVSSALRHAQLREAWPELVAVTPGDAHDAQIVTLAEMDDPSTAVELLDLADWPTAAGQGALAVVTRAGDEALAASADHRPSRLTVLAELALLERVGSGAGWSLAAHAELADGLLFLSGRRYNEGGGHATSSHALYPEDSRDPAGELAERVAAELLAGGEDGGSP